ncbi:hypothetical protein FKP32DRAFT_906658 [Trametes sanguinea]|nr:hypothetical protein FKP32DRAFT_906658 [Trametes sanguinea]
MAMDAHVGDTGPSRSTLISAIVAFCLESFLFGAFAVAYGIAVWMLLLSERPPGRMKQDVVLFSASTAMFLLAFLHVALDMTINLRTFLSDGRELSILAKTFDSLNGLENPIGVVKSILYITQSLIGDSFMLYRAYVVWDRSWRVIILPSFILFADVVIGYATSFLGSKAPAGCVNAFFVWSFMTNAIASGLIMRRILVAQGYRDNQLQRMQFRSMRRRVIESLFQSAAIYSVGSISLAITAFISPDVGFTACHSIFSSIIGLVFVLVVIRIRHGAGSTMADGQRSTMHQSVTEGYLGAQGAVQLGVLHPSPTTLRRPIAIAVSISATSDRCGTSSKANDSDDGLEDKFGTTKHSQLSSTEVNAGDMESGGV